MMEMKKDNRRSSDMNPALIEARRLCSDVTPLRSDCGRVCGAACCASLPGEETGMLLFPGEEETVRDLPGWTVCASALGPLVRCPGRCDRENRPLSCRLFPLLPVLREGEIRVETDLRAGAVCPLSRQGQSALSPAFIQAVRDAGEALEKDPVQRAFLEKLTREQDDLRALRQAWRAGTR